VEWPAITGIGPDALIVASAEDRRGPIDETDQALIAGQLELEGKLVLDEAGDALGKLSDIAFDEKTGRLIEIDMLGHAMPIESVVAHGSYALIIPVPG